MLRSIEGILGYQLLAKDGEVGRVHDVFLDDQHWQIRYLVVETGGWLNRRHVLIAPSALRAIDAERGGFVVDLTRRQVQNSPDIDTDKPVSRQQELVMNAYYGWPADWAGEPMVVPMPEYNLPRQNFATEESGSHLRSYREITTYTVDYKGEGQSRLQGAKVQDFVIDDVLWIARIMVVSTGGWLDSRPVAIPASGIQSISWAEQKVHLNLTHEQASNLAFFDPSAAVNREDRTVYTDYYGRRASK